MEKIIRVFGTALLCFGVSLSLSGCPALSMTIPIGERAKFGAIKASAEYIPPETFPDITRTLNDK